MPPTTVMTETEYQKGEIESRKVQARFNLPTIGTGRCDWILLSDFLENAHEDYYRVWLRYGKLRPSEMYIAFDIDGNITICLLCHFSRIFTGWAKRNPNYDIPDCHRGQVIAFSRALQRHG